MRFVLCTVGMLWCCLLDWCWSVMLLVRLLCRCCGWFVVFAWLRTLFGGYVFGMCFLVFLVGVGAGCCFLLFFVGCY